MRGTTDLDGDLSFELQSTSARKRQRARGRRYLEQRTKVGGRRALLGVEGVGVDFVQERIGVEVETVKVIHAVEFVVPGLRPEPGMTIAYFAPTNRIYVNHTPLRRDSQKVTTHQSMSRHNGGRGKRTRAACAGAVGTSDVGTGGHSQRACVRWAE